MFGSMLSDNKCIFDTFAIILTIYSYYFIYWKTDNDINILEFVF